MSNKLLVLWLQDIYAEEPCAARSRLVKCKGDQDTVWSEKQSTQHCDYMGGFSDGFQ